MDIHYPFKQQIDYGLPFMVHDDVHLFRLPIPDNLKYINTYLIKHNQGWYIYDTGMATATNKQFWQQLIEQGDYHFCGIIISHHHPDHLGLANWLQQQLDVPVYMDEQEYQTIERILVDTTQNTMPANFADFFELFSIPKAEVSQYFALMQGINQLHSGLPKNWLPISQCPLLSGGWQLIKGQGHSPQVGCLYHQQHQLFISSDQVLPEISSIVYSSWTREQINPLDLWLKSLHRLLNVPNDVLVLPAHKHPFTGLHSRISAIIDIHQQRLQRLQKLLKSHGLDDLPWLTAQMYSKDLTELADRFMAAGETLAHIEYLLAQQGETL